MPASSPDPMYGRAQDPSTRKDIYGKASRRFARRGSRRRSGFITTPQGAEIKVPERARRS
jgi:hypothetical protein